MVKCNSNGFIKDDPVIITPSPFDLVGIICTIDCFLIPEFRKIKSTYLADIYV